MSSPPLPPPPALPTNSPARARAAPPPRATSSTPAAIAAAGAAVQLASGPLPRCHLPTPAPLLASRPFTAPRASTRALQLHPTPELPSWLQAAAPAQTVLPPQMGGPMFWAAYQQALLGQQRVAGGSPATALPSATSMGLGRLANVNPTTPASVTASDPIVPFTVPRSKPKKKRGRPAGSKNNTANKIKTSERAEAAYSTRCKPYSCNDAASDFV